MDARLRCIAQMETGFVVDVCGPTLPEIGHFKTVDRMAGGA
jgi:hypothetical protein